MDESPCINTNNNNNGQRLQQQMSGLPQQNQMHMQQLSYDPLMQQSGAIPGHYPPHPMMYQQPPPIGMMGAPVPGMMHNQQPPPMMNLPRYDEEYISHLKLMNDKLGQIRQEIEQMPRSDLEQFKDQKLPLARIKKIMKSDEDVRMISAEAPILFAKACEMFIVEMTHKAYYYAKKNNRKTLQRNDIAAAITDTEIYDFLLDIMPRDEMIANAKDNKLSDYQMTLLNDVMKMQEIQQHQLTQGQIGPSKPLLIINSAEQQQMNQSRGDPEDLDGTTSHAAAAGGGNAEERKEGGNNGEPKKRGRKPLPK